MDGTKSRSALLEFLDYLHKKGLLNKNTASARKAAVSNVLRLLDDQEAQDVSKIDLDELMRRFSNLEGSRYKPESLAVYKSRVKAAIDDFLKYVDNPMTFRPSAQGASTKSERSRGSGAERRTSSDATPGSARTVSEDSHPTAVNILPIPIRADLTVLIQGIPYNLTAAEANKIANVVRAMAAEE